MTIGELLVKIGADFSNFASIGDDMERALAPIQRRLQQMGTALTAGITVPVTLLATRIVTAVSRMDQMERALTAVMGSGELAARELENLREVARLPGLGFAEAVEGSAQLQAVGFAAAEAREILLQFGNAIASTGGGRAELQRVIIQLQQMRSAGALLMSDFRPILQTVPLVGRALQEAFGTQNLEAIRATGISAEDFIQRLTEQLGQMDRVTGGISNAFENLGDTIFTEMARAGDVLEPVIEKVLSLASDAIVTLVDAFERLPRGVQLGVAALGVAAAALGPLLLAVSGVVAALPALSAGLAVLTGPVGAIAAATVAAAGLIIANWDRVKEMVEGPLASAWEGIQRVVAVAGEVFSDVMGSIRQIADAVISDVSAIWDEWGDLIISVAETAWRHVQSTVIGALRIIGDVVGAFADILTADWSGLMERLQSIAETILRTIVRNWVATFATLLDVVAKFAEALPLVGQAVSGALAVVSSAMDDWVERSLDATSAVKGGLLEVGAGLGQVGEQGEESGEQAASGLDTLGSAAGGAAGEVSRIDEILASLPARLQAASEKALAFGTPLEAAVAKVKEIRRATEQLIDEGLTRADEAVQTLVASYEEARTAALNLAAAQAGRPEAAPPAELPGLDTADSDKVLEDRLAKMKETLAAMRETLGIGQKITFNFAGMINSALSEMVVGVAEALGESVANFKSFGDSLSAVGNVVFSTLAGLAIKVGKIAIATGLAVSGIKKALLTLNPVAAIAAGAALIALGSAAKSALASAAGGSAGTPSLGQGGGTSFNFNANRPVQAAQAQSGFRQTISLRPAVVPSGDLVFAEDEGRRRQDKYGTQLN